MKSWDVGRIVLWISRGLVVTTPALLLAMCILVLRDTPRAPAQNHAIVRNGAPTPGVPCWAVYNYNGVLVARTALASDIGVLREFNVLGGPINPEPLPEPWRWYELSAEFSKENP